MNSEANLPRPRYRNFFEEKPRWIDELGGATMLIRPPREKTIRVVIAHKYLYYIVSYTTYLL